MYEEFFNLKQKPFRKTPDPSFLYLSKHHEEALARMMLTAEEQEFMLLIGDVGAGKTTLSRVMMDQLDDTYRVALVINPVLTPNGILRTLAKKFGVEKPARYKDDLLEQVYGALWEMHEQGLTPVLIIDEAHLIPSRKVYEELRLLTNYQLDDKNLLALILMGQPEIEKRLKRKDYQAFVQRIGIRYYLGPFDSVKETARYITYRLKVAGRKKPIFNDDAIEKIFDFSNGLPRKINNICGNALLDAFAREQTTIGPDIILDVANDLGIIEELRS